MPGVSCTTYIGCYVQAPCLAFLQPFPGNWKIDAMHGVSATISRQLENRRHAWRLCNNMSFYNLRRQAWRLYNHSLVTAK